MVGQSLEPILELSEDENHGLRTEFDHSSQTDIRSKCNLDSTGATNTVRGRVDEVEQQKAQEFFQLPKSVDDGVEVGFKFAPVAKKAMITSRIHSSISTTPKFQPQPLGGEYEEIAYKAKDANNTNASSTREAERSMKNFQSGTELDSFMERTQDSDTLFQSAGSISEIQNVEEPQDTATMVEKPISTIATIPEIEKDPDNSTSFHLKIPFETTLTNTHSISPGNSPLIQPAVHTLRDKTSLASPKMIHSKLHSATEAENSKHAYPQHFTKSPLKSPSIRLPERPSTTIRQPQISESPLAELVKPDNFQGGSKPSPSRRAPRSPKAKRGLPIPAISQNSQSPAPSTSQVLNLLLWSMEQEKQDVRATEASKLLALEREIQEIKYDESILQSKLEISDSAKAVLESEALEKSAKIVALNAKKSTIEKYATGLTRDLDIQRSKTSKLHEKVTELSSEVRSLLAEHRENRTLWDQATKELRDSNSKLRAETLQLRTSMKFLEEQRESLGMKLDEHAREAIQAKDNRSWMEYQFNSLTALQHTDRAFHELNQKELLELLGRIYESIGSWKSSDDSEKTQVRQRIEELISRSHISPEDLDQLLNLPKDLQHRLEKNTSELMKSTTAEAETLAHERIAEFDRIEKSVFDLRQEVLSSRTLQAQIAELRESNIVLQTGTTLKDLQLEEKNEEVRALREEHANTTAKLNELEVDASRKNHISNIKIEKLERQLLESRGQLQNAQEVEAGLHAKFQAVQDELRISEGLLRNIEDQKCEIEKEMATKLKEKTQELSDSARVLLNQQKADYTNQLYKEQQKRIEIQSTLEKERSKQVELRQLLARSTQDEEKLRQELGQALEESKGYRMRISPPKPTTGGNTDIPYASQGLVDEAREPSVASPKVAHGSRTSVLKIRRFSEIESVGEENQTAQESVISELSEPVSSPSADVSTIQEPPQPEEERCSPRGIKGSDFATPLRGQGATRGNHNADGPPKSRSRGSTPFVSGLSVDDPFVSAEPTNSQPKLSSLKSESAPRKQKGSGSSPDFLNPDTRRNVRRFGHVNTRVLPNMPTSTAPENHISRHSTQMERKRLHALEDESLTPFKSRRTDTSATKSNKSGVPVTKFGAESDNLAISSIQPGQFHRQPNLLSSTESRLRPRRQNSQRRNTSRGSARKKSTKMARRFSRELAND